RDGRCDSNAAWCPASREILVLSTASANRMSETERAEETLAYATPPAVPTRQSGFAVASIIVACLAVAWQATSDFTEGLLPFDLYKQHRIGSVCALVAVALAFAAYRQRFRRRGLAHVAMIVSVVAFFFAAVFAVPL
ncbi:MAG TPA: hypothetical protein VHI52_11765, partial [Verrucomicrobiae bacterium]|nr:hypothetical protein [Verrucomicrobiae bacterium]